MRQYACARNSAKNLEGMREHLLPMWGTLVLALKKLPFCVTSLGKDG